MNVCDESENHANYYIILPHNSNIAVILSIEFYKRKIGSTYAMSYMKTGHKTKYLNAH